MGGGGRDADVLDRWLSGEGRAALDGLSGSALDVIGVVDRDLITRYVNWTAPGLTREAVIGMSVLDLVPPSYRELSREVYERVLRTGNGERFETLYSDEHGVLVWTVRVGPIRHEGAILGLITISTDVTEQRREFVDRDRFFALSLDMLVVATRDGRLKRVNPALGEALGYTPQELIDQRFLDLVHPDDVESTRAASAQVRSGHALSTFENRYRRRDGTYRVFSWQATVDPVTGDVYAVARDITEQRAAETQLRHAQKMEAVGQLAGGIAHDFNNLMQAVLMNVELAVTTTNPSLAVIDHLHEIEGAGRRAADLTKQLLMFSRRQPLRRANVDLNELMQSLMKMLRRLLPENITIDLKAGGGLASVNADRTQLEQVIINLCVNARDAMESGGKLSIETENVLINDHDCQLHPWAKPGRFVRLCVTDTGEGMSPEVRERVFDPFFTTKDNLRGTGLGLATVYGIVQQHGGLVHVYSELGHGTTFKVYLPADERAATPVDIRAATEIKQRAGRETILVAEDEELVSRPLIQMLERAGYRTLVANNGVEAVRLLRAHLHTVDVAMLDVVMPELGGPQAWEQMRVLRPDLRVIFTSGYADDRYRERLPHDAEVLEKPFHTDALLSAIRKILDSKP